LAEKTNMTRQVINCPYVEKCSAMNFGVKKRKTMKGLILSALVVELSNPSRTEFVTQRMAMFSGIIALDAATDFRICYCVKSQHAGTSLFLHSNLALFLWSDRSGSVSYLKSLNVTL
jgi:hypothetical protein